MNRYLEICIDSLASARFAIQGGADRLEVCSALALGGLTPYTALVRRIREESKIPMRCLIRPRSGDFLYSQDEVQLMVDQIHELKNAGSDGFVIGCLTVDGDLDDHSMKQLIDAAEGSDLTLHRCIDVSRNPQETYLRAAHLGFDAVLTSGAAGNCIAGIDTIKTLLQLRDQHKGPEVLIGAGVNAASIETILTSLPQASAFHASCKALVESKMRFRRMDVPMGLPGLDEWHIQQTDEAQVRFLKKFLQL